MVTHHHQDGHPSFPGRLATINVCAHEDTIPSTTEEEESTSSMSKFFENDAVVFWPSTDSIKKSCKIEEQKYIEIKLLS